MARFRVCPKTGLRRGAWCPEEDKILAAYIAKHGHLNWKLLPQQAGLARDGKSCRLRWMNYLRPNLKRGNFTQEEDEVIIRMHARLGNRWSAIAFSLPGRSDNEIKNRWHTRLEKLSKRNVELEGTNLQSIEASSAAPPCLENNTSYLDFGNFLGETFVPQNSVLVTEGYSYDDMTFSSMEEFSPLEIALEGLLCMGVNII